ncbi:MAG: hypothetical protein AAFR59_14125, partial [Bacteroidota bacterium]
GKTFFLFLKNESLHNDDHESMLMGIADHICGKSPQHAMFCIQYHLLDSSLSHEAKHRGKLGRTFLLDELAYS